MRDEFAPYLASIGILQGVILQRIKTIYEFFREECGEEIADIFVTDYITEDGSREYENLWFFSDRCCMEAKGFITRDEFDSAPLKNRIVRWEVRKQDYDFKKAIQESRLYLRVFLEEEWAMGLKAAAGNCDYLRDIFRRYVVPNVKE